MGNETSSYDFHILTNHAAEQRATARRKKLEEAPHLPRESKIAAGLGGLVIVLVASVAMARSYANAPAPQTVTPAIKTAPRAEPEVDLEAPESR